ncbi:outer membrane protein assembly factor BamE [Azoarcus sp. PA01]|nr:outer membrane protein assembly factor BamE [Azoarcus sp. PA01]
MRFVTLLAAVAAVGLLAGCSISPLTNQITPYRIDVRQGNYVDQEMVAKLKKGMTREQVRFALGTPLIVDVFHPDRWDYVYRFQPGRGEPQQRTLSVFFVSDRLDHVEGDIESGDAQAATAAPQAERSRVVEIAPAVED